jgi:predicted metal-binding membrane protein
VDWRGSCVKGQDGYGDRVDSRAARLQRFLMKVQENIGGRRAIALAALLLGITAFAWLGVIRSAAAMQMSQGVDPLSGAAGVAFTLQWGVMMTAMMLPSAAPMILLYGMVSRRLRESTERVIPAEMFALTYVALWMLTGVPVYMAWVGIGQLAAGSRTFAAAMPYAIAATLLVTGLYQLSPAKGACLRQCQAPADFLMSRWRSSYAASLRLAATHAAYCIGCCWALMLLLVVAGAMSLPWALAIALVVFAEKVLPAGERTAPIIGVILIVAALAVVVRPELAAALRPHGLH